MMNQKNCLQASQDIVRLISWFVMLENTCQQHRHNGPINRSDNNGLYELFALTDSGRIFFNVYALRLIEPLPWSPHQ